ncbi:MAG TPA: hypothetical protein VGY66_06240 [Gemmataceae bacterium]|jgi:hypothetical protein|nr:hypothetical protein [Gemmataceae bacterium]
MPYVTSIERIARQEGKAEGKAEGKVEAKRKAGWRKKPTLSSDS